MTPSELAPRLFIAMVVIVLVCRGAAWLLGKAGQPPVVSEMLAGVLLGPSLLGLLLPGVQDALFPDQLRPVLYVLGQIGLILFMFTAGYEFAAHRPGKIAGTAGIVSLAGILAPLTLGVALTFVARDHVDVFAEGVSTPVSAAFVGVALAITAFPMLARIVTERGHAGTPHGSLALASGAIDDVVAWILLAFVLATASGEFGPALLTVGGAILFAVGLGLGGRRVTTALFERTRFDPQKRLIGVLLLLLAVAWYTDEIGLYAVFGAFCVGLVLPRRAESEEVMGAVAPLGTGLFLPLFFTYSGLNTKFGLLGDPAVLLFALACVLTAVVGKFGACWVAARASGQPPLVAARVGALMNARGLMQLIALNVGLEAGIVSDRMFTALVLVALVTTLMTTPALTLIDRLEARRATARIPQEIA
ncbi:cation:proton antiporter [Kineosporia succinea]|uniref:Kef-type K+ transport system membrane component KefB n=1 Tax=Kineosporia succinea TaxID=84632 RepID=A0ABT9NW36_9ACTN|nr:cation:proton antiporter [Kineosporia succinea]MDP9824632.1 Kef-type K+ transport system membrane component KefB [Kineosporia succinea]